MFENTFKNIDDILHKDAGCGSELDYAEQSSWVLFLKYIDDLESARKVGAELGNKKYTPIISGKYRWTEWANEHTFHIADWMLNDFAIYQNMKRFMQDFDGQIPYRSWFKEMGLVDQSTTSGWKLMDDGVHYGDLSEVMRASML